MTLNHACIKGSIGKILASKQSCIANIKVHVQVHVVNQVKSYLHIRINYVCMYSSYILGNFSKSSYSGFTHDEHIKYYNAVFSAK